jgi:hypothetical protein
MKKNGQSNYLFKLYCRGVVILFNIDVEYKVHNSYKDNSGNLLIIDLEIYQHRITLATI